MKTGRQLLNELDNEQLAMAIAAICDGISIVAPRLIEADSGIRELSKTEQGMISIKAGIVLKFLEEDASAGINIAEG